MAEKDLVYRGKSKDVFRITGGPHAGKYRLVFTDRATGYLENGKTVFDPGYDIVVGDIPGKGAIDLPRVLQAISAIGYEGFITVELYTYEEEAAEAAQAAYRYLHGWQGRFQDRVGPEH